MPNNHDYELLRKKIRVDEEVEAALNHLIDRDVGTLDFVELNEMGLIVESRGIIVYYKAYDYQWKED